MTTTEFVSTSSNCCLNVSSQTPSADSDEGSKLVTLGACVCMLVLCLIGIYGNTVSMLIFTQSSMRCSINILLTALSGVDLVILLLSVPVFVIPGLNFYRATETWSDGLYPFVIRYLYPCIMISQTCSVWTFVLISVERYLAVCYPFDVNKYMTASRARYLQCMVFLSAVFYNLIRFWEYEALAERPWFRPYLRDDGYYFTIYVTGLYLATHYAAPFLAILILNVKIVLAMNSSHQQRRLLNPYQSREYRTAQMVIVATTMFGLCNSLAFVLNILEARDKTFFFGDYQFLAYLLLDVSNILILLNSASNFVIYLLYCEQYRALFKRFNDCRLRFVYGNVSGNKFDWGDTNLEFNEIRSSFCFLKRPTKASIFSAGASSLTQTDQYVDYKRNSFLTPP